MAQPNQEPSMEDILASIKRIIAEDSEAVGARPARLRREAMSAVSASSVVMPLRAPDADPEIAEEGLPEEVAEAEALEAAAEAPAEPAETPRESPDVLELTSPMTDTATAEAPAIAAEAETPAAAAPSAGGLDGLVSTTSAQASRNAFAALSQIQVRSDEGKSNTLEGLVADLLKPMLREWLDRELPGMVERLVAAEVKRLAGS